MAMTRAKAKGRRDAGRYAGLPHTVMEHPDYVLLSGNAVRLLVELIKQFNGYNNGDLSAAFSTMRGRGVTRSKTTLAKLLRELERADFITCTRRARFLNPGARCALYALTWKPINECPGKDLEVNPTVTPPRAFSIKNNKKPSPFSDASGAKK